MNICSCCGRDIDALGQDNMSYVSGHALCEDCSAGVEEIIEDMPTYCKDCES